MYGNLSQQSGGNPQDGLAYALGLNGSSALSPSTYGGLSESGYSNGGGGAYQPPARNYNVSTNQNTPFGPILNFPQQTGSAEYAGGAYAGGAYGYGPMAQTQPQIVQQNIARSVASGYPTAFNLYGASVIAPNPIPQGGESVLTPYGINDMITPGGQVMPAAWAILTTPSYAGWQTQGQANAAALGGMPGGFGGLGGWGGSSASVRRTYYPLNSNQQVAPGSSAAYRGGAYGRPNRPYVLPSSQSYWKNGRFYPGIE